MLVVARVIVRIPVEWKVELQVLVEGPHEVVLRALRRVDAETDAVQGEGGLVAAGPRAAVLGVRQHGRGLVVDRHPRLRVRVAPVQAEFSRGAVKHSGGGIAFLNARQNRVDRLGKRDHGIVATVT